MKYTLKIENNKSEIHELETENLYAIKQIVKQAYKENNNSIKNILIFDEQGKDITKEIDFYGLLK